MCNEVRRAVALGQIHDEFSELRIPLRFPEGLPNLAPLDSIRITDPTAIVRSGAEGTELVMRRWSWPGPNKKPVYNYRSEGREFANSTTGGRCLIPVDGFYEFTAPADPKARRKHKWLFTRPGAPFFCIAGLWRTSGDVGEAFTMLTTEPGPDVAPYHGRQVAVLDRGDWGAWLDASVPARELIRPLPAGTLAVEQIS
ncbi:SOS response-associated peptidase [Sphingosinicella sp. YJ22]|uniref:SOS response-associated peptidase n=1 Tax=Sphingosinicella sp. YJ22 TaxID=1104780 RepID=UPI00140964C4|nr:SOS response-associated peptidase [Sphingosinicella sp. YJ22]